jgi:Leucine-rich repeat (LRR) protein
MKTTKLYTALLLGLCVTLLSSCKEDSKIVPPILESGTTAITVPAGGGQATLQIKANVAWDVAETSPWLTASKINPEELLIVATASVSARTGMVRCIAPQSGLSLEITVNQQQATAAQTDSLALVALYNATKGLTWVKKWNLAQPLNRWNGITVSGDRVTQVALFNNNLTGSLPEEFFLLSEMTNCDLSNNNLSGDLQGKFNVLTKLTTLDLSGNQFSGTIPELSALTRLFMVDLSNNSLSGTLPAWLTSLTDLEFVGLHKNQLTGTLPGNWSQLSRLHTLDLSYNQLSGGIPAEWAALTNMRTLYLYENTLDGTIPGFLTTFTHLGLLALDGNNLTGSIPTDMGTLPELTGLWLEQNRLTGNIPASLLNHVYWNTWAAHIVPQQAGYGFDNYPLRPVAPAASNQADNHPRPEKGLYKK